LRWERNFDSVAWNHFISIVFNTLSIFKLQFSNFGRKWRLGILELPIGSTRKSLILFSPFSTGTLQNFHFFSFLQLWSTFHLFLITIRCDSSAFCYMRSVFGFYHLFHMSQIFNLFKFVLHFNYPLNQILIMKYRTRLLRIIEKSDFVVL
jgi:hypothetical protein